MSNETVDAIDQTVGADTSDPRREPEPHEPPSQFVLRGTAKPHCRYGICSNLEKKGWDGNRGDLELQPRET
ncbi:hypothetical protein EYF80_037111 [Liparis tanakae]|uniref:Uncharacterized protein n=1 Tax=Liparis tanakae TaxID=230148 RepID=A0A4Z2GH77_9TELE|nr:hypothetical protein EYF80_037111 [Liparis tanakae]